MSKIFFTSDTHFGCEQTLKNSFRPFNSVEEMDEAIIANWNSVVGKDDIVYHLGDFGDLATSHRLNGQIHLIIGNHELKNHGNRDIKYKFREFCRKYNFKDICFNKKIELNNQKFYLTHKPSHYLQHNEYFTLFGHLHRFALIKTFGLNVGQDMHFFKPIDISTVFHYQRLIEKRYKHDIDILV